jgi:hypothetical protein
MKFHILTLIFAALVLPAKADLSSCQNSCYETKKRCNDQKKHTFNSCNQDLFACRASCESGKPHKTYGGLPLNISFQPILRL